MSQSLRCSNISFGTHSVEVLLKRLALIALLFWCIPAARSQSVACSQSVLLSGASSGVTNLITLPGGKNYIRICAVYFQLQQAATATNFGLVSGTGATCTGSQTSLTPQWIGVASAVQGYSQEMPSNASFTAPTTTNVCLKLTATPTASNVQVLYDFY